MKAQYMVMFVVLLSGAYAFEINSTSYTVERYFDGSSGSIGESASYTLRQTGQPQGTSENATSSSVEANVGVYEEQVLDSTDPVVVLVSPGNGSTWSNGSSVPFYYNVTDDSSIAFCELLINGLPVSNNTIITQGLNAISRIMVNGAYTWAIGCQDVYGNYATSGNYSITVAINPPSGSGISTPSTQEPRAAETLPAAPKVVIPLSNTLKYLFLLLIVYSIWLLFIYKRDKEEKRKKRPEDIFIK
jgi:hypothetical protein